MNRRRLLAIAGLVGVLALVLVVGEALPPFRLRLASEILIFGLFALSLDVLLGYTGLPSLGHALYFGSAAYASAVVARDHTDSFLAGLAAGVVVAALVAAVAGLSALRTAGVFFLMITLAFGQLGVAVALRMSSVTGGADGLAGVLKPELPLAGVDLYDPRHFFYFTAVVVAVFVALALWLVRSPFGAALKGVRENPERMSALGYNVWAHRYIAFVVSAALAGGAGVLLSYHHGFVNPEVVGLTTSAEAMLMVILGGSGTLFGPLLGAAGILIFEDVSRGIADRWRLLLGLIYVATVLIARKGLLGSLPAAWKRLSRSRRSTRSARSARSATPATSDGSKESAWKEA